MGNDQYKGKGDLLDQLHQQDREMESWKKELESRTQALESQLGYLEKMKVKLETNVSNLVEENERYRDDNAKLKESQLALEESNRKTLQEYEQNLGCLEGDVLELLLPKSNTGSQIYHFVQDSVKTWIKNNNA